MFLWYWCVLFFLYQGCDVGVWDVMWRLAWRFDVIDTDTDGNFKANTKRLLLDVTYGMFLLLNVTDEML